MDNTVFLMSLFDESTKTADAIDYLNGMGFSEEDIVVITGVPYPENAFGHRKEWFRLPYVVLGGACAGFVFGFFLSVMTPRLYPLIVGGRPIVTGPPAAIIIYIFTMMAIIVSTFLGVIWEMGFPSFEKKYYSTLVTSGHIAILLECPPNKEPEIRKALEANGGYQIHNPEKFSI